MIAVQTLKSITKNKFNDDNLLNDYYTSLKNPEVKALRNLIPLEDKILCKYTSLLEDSAKEFAHCQKCKGLAMCKNEMPGYVYFPNVKNTNLCFNYQACKYKQKEIETNKYQKNIDLFNVPTSLKNAKMKNIYVDDESRVEVIKYTTDYYKKFFTENRTKGLYLYGNFGCGKTYIIAALFNELAKKNIKSAIVYFPEFLRNLKSSFKDEKENNDISFENKFTYIKKIPLLLIDDISAENVTAWSRDEILGTILQYRMEENLPTFFTSNLSLEELETHLSISSQKIEVLKARRIIERIKYLTNEMKLIGFDRRK